MVGSGAGNEHIFKGDLIVKTFTFDFNFDLRYGLRLLVLKYSFKPGDVIGKGMESANNVARKWPILPFDVSRDFIISKKILV